MTNILLNYYNFDGSWTQGKLKKYIKGRVLILPLAFREWEINDDDSWQKIYGEGGEKYENILSPFLSYGIERKNIRWVNYFREQDVVGMIRQSDLLFFTGGMPEKAVARINEMGITDAVRKFDGVVAGASAGAMLQLETYHVTPDEDYDGYQVQHGLGLVKGIDLEVHFLNTDVQRHCTRRAVDTLGMPVYQMWHEGGLLVEGKNVTLLGNVQVVLPQK